MYSKLTLKLLLAIMLHNLDHTHTVMHAQRDTTQCYIYRAKPAAYSCSNDILCVGTDDCTVPYSMAYS
jgi:hypothetical protein